MKALLESIGIEELKTGLEEVPLELWNKNLHRFEKGGAEGRSLTRTRKGRD